MQILNNLFGLSKNIKHVLKINDPEPIDKLGGMLGINNSTPSYTPQKTTSDFFPTEVAGNVQKARQWVYDQTVPRNDQGLPLSDQEAKKQGMLKVGTRYIAPIAGMGRLKTVKNDAVYLQYQKEFLNRTASYKNAVKENLSKTVQKQRLQSVNMFQKLMDKRRLYLQKAWNKPR